MTQWHKNIYQKGQAHKEITMNIISLPNWLGEKNDECLSLSKNQKWPNDLNIFYQWSDELGEKMMKVSDHPKSQEDKGWKEKW